MKPELFEQFVRIAAALALSGFWNDKDRSGRCHDNQDVAEAKILSRILMGHEVGLSPVTAVREISIFHGKPTMSANVIASLVQASERYSFRVLESDDSTCSIAYFDGEERLGVSTWTLADATRAGLMGGGQWQKYPRAMLYARAQTEGVRRYCPSVSKGGIYTAEEMDFDQDNVEVPDCPNPSPVASAIVEAPPETAPPPQPHAGNPSPLELAARRDDGPPPQDDRHAPPQGQEIETYAERARAGIGDHAASGPAMAPSGEVSREALLVEVPKLIKECRGTTISDRDIIDALGGAVQTPKSLRGMRTDALAGMAMALGALLAKPSAVTPTAPINKHDAVDRVMMAMASATSRYGVDRGKIAAECNWGLGRDEAESFGLDRLGDIEDALNKMMGIA